MCYICGCVCPSGTCGSKDNLWSSFPPFTFIWTGLKPQSWGVCSKCRYRWSHLTVPKQACFQNLRKLILSKRGKMGVLWSERHNMVGVVCKQKGSSSGPRQCIATSAILPARHWSLRSTAHPQPGPRDKGLQASFTSYKAPLQLCWDWKLSWSCTSSEHFHWGHLVRCSPCMEGTSVC